MYIPLFPISRDTGTKNKVARLWWRTYLRPRHKLQPKGEIGGMSKAVEHWL